ncbi:hypothetical protein Bca52824_095580 [Brassica carinata]|uniref:Uncharacterized protein n=1 Tax=Brassica carinata TaxID=52824 RepID=A0A8X7P1I0_BRACI|nr:hypothetical protein Bca52824_095580 [Brassica carinata]
MGDEHPLMIPMLPNEHLESNTKASPYIIANPVNLSDGLTRICGLNLQEWPRFDHNRIFERAPRITVVEADMSGPSRREGHYSSPLMDYVDDGVSYLAPYHGRLGHTSSMYTGRVCPGITSYFDLLNEAAFGSSGRRENRSMAQSAPRTMI